MISFKTEKSVNFAKVVPERLVKEYKKEWKMENAEKLTYHIRSIYVFQRINGVDIPFLSFYTQEYPTRKLCILDYLDTVPFTTPNKLRPICTEALILGYYRFMAAKGFEKGHFWANAPLKFDGYVFYSHPVDQKYLEQIDLENWYVDILTKGVVRGDIDKFWDFEEEMGPDLDVMRLPVFHGSLWTEHLFNADKHVKENHTEEELKDYEFYKKKFIDYIQWDVYMEFEKSHFYVDLKKKNDERFIGARQDPFRRNEIMDTRDVFLVECERRNWEFSTMRRVKHTALGMINWFLS